jgi:hypothetical protein
VSYEPGACCRARRVKSVAAACATAVDVGDAVILSEVGDNRLSERGFERASEYGAGARKRQEGVFFIAYNETSWSRTAWMTP